MAEPNPENEPTIVERWLEDQQQWQRTILAYLDSMTKNDDFLVHLGNAMRGSLLAGKAYPTAPPPPAAAAPADPVADDRFEKVLFALRQLEGELRDLQMALDEIREGRLPSTASKAPPARKKTKPAVKTAGAVRRRAPKARKTKGRA